MTKRAPPDGMDDQDTLDRAGLSRPVPDPDPDPVRGFVPVPAPVPNPEPEPALFDAALFGAGAAPGRKETRGRPSLYKTDEERRAAKRISDKLYRDRNRDNRGGQSGAEDAPLKTIVIAPEAYKFTADMLVATVDLVLLAISDNGYKAPDEARSNYAKAWTKYLESVGAEPPPWVMVLIMSGAYAAPAFATPAGQSKMEKLTGKIKSWWAGKFGG